MPRKNPPGPKRKRGRPKGTTREFLEARRIGIPEPVVPPKPAPGTSPKNGVRPPPRAPWQPTQSQRDGIKVLRANGTTIECIARVIGIDPQTLTKHCRAELDHGHEDVVARAGAELLRRGMGVPATATSPGVPGKDACLIHWLSCRGGPEWKKRDDDPASLADLVAAFRSLAEQARVEAHNRGLDPGAVEPRPPGPVQH